jgi:general secretion pathway protein G
MPFSRSQKREVRSEKNNIARGRRAFTLVEIMIVVVIIGLMAGIITYATTGMLDKAKRKRAISDIVTLDGAVDLYHGDRDKFPTNQEGLAVLVPQYIKVLQNDPWGRPYQYVQPGRTRAYDIISYGADGREGGSGADADITNSDVEVTSAAKK